jgi:hypothetical protein
MVAIEIDDDVFNILKSLAEPFVDTPNTVLRRILNIGEEATKLAAFSVTSTINHVKTNARVPSEVFMSSYLSSQYKEKFKTRVPYRTMFESENYIIYFQNFNKAGTVNLWYRLNADSLKVLRNTGKVVHICFTNPAEKYAYEIPLKDIDSQAEKAKWMRNSYEVNIDPVNSRWRELDWKIDRYYVEINI